MLTMLFAEKDGICKIFENLIFDSKLQEEPLRLMRTFFFQERKCIKKKESGKYYSRIRDVGISIVRDHC